MNRIICSIAILCFLSTVSASSYVDSGSYNIEEVAELVCKTTKGTEHLISKVSTINELADFLGEVSSEHKLYECGKQYLGSLMQLANVVEAAADDVCGEEKLTLIEDFHRRYVSKISRHVKERKQASGAPKMVRLFFIQYATEVSSKCEQAALQVISNNKHHFQNSNLDELRKFTDALGMTDLSQGYNGIYLFWNMIDNLALAENEKFARYLAASGATRVNFMTKDAKKIGLLQAVCEHKMRPIYSRSILPVLRLIDMGYYPHGTQLSEELNSEPAARGLFYAAQVCETIRPVAVYSDDKLEEDQAIFITRDEAARQTLPQLEGIEKLTQSEPQIEVAPTQLNAAELTIGSTPVEEIKASVEFRSKIVNRMLRHLFALIKDKLKASMGSFKLFRKTEDHKLEQIDEKSLEGADVENQLQIREESEEGLARRKRYIQDFFESIVAVLYGVFTVLIAIIYIIIKVAILITPTIILSFGYLFFSPDNVNAFMAALWDSI